MIDIDTLPSIAQLALAWLNSLLCAVVAWSCVCRIRLMDERTTRTRFRVGYSLLLACAASSGGSPVLWGELPGPGQISMALAVLYVIGVGSGAWRRGVPDYARKDAS